MTQTANPDIPRGRAQNFGLDDRIVIHRSNPKQKIRRDLYDEWSLVDTRPFPVNFRDELFSLEYPSCHHEIFKCHAMTFHCFICFWTFCFLFLSNLTCAGFERGAFAWGCNIFSTVSMASRWSLLWALSAYITGLIQTFKFNTLPWNVFSADAINSITQENKSRRMKLNDQSAHLYAHTSGRARNCTTFNAK